MACMQQTRPSCESTEQAKHNHKSNAYSSQAGSQVAGAVACNPASANNHHNQGGYHKFTEKVTGIFSSNKNHQGSGCHGHQDVAHGSHGHQVVAHGSHQVVAHGNHSHQAAAHASHGHNGSGCNGSSHSHSHSHHKTSSQESYVEEKKEYTSCKEGGKKKVEKKVKKKSSYKCNSSDSESDKDHC